MEYERLKENLQILDAHNHGQGKVINLTGGQKTETVLIYEIVSDCREIIRKIEQGMLIELPCPIRTMVYYIASYKKKIGFWGKWKYCNTIMEIPFELEMLDTYGNNWFLTREEAEKRLLELQGETKL